MDKPTEEPSKEELLLRIKQLEVHVQQLKNVIAKGNNTHTKGKKRKGQRPFDVTKYNSRHVALKILYLGWDYHGLATQEDTNNTIEAALFDVLVKTRLIESRQTSNYHRCGRTDKGVSAFSQVISIDLRSNLLEGLGVKVRENGTAHERKGDTTTEIEYVHILNKVLPAEIRVLAWAPVDVDFSSRFSCLRRTYKYFFPRGDLDIEAMRGAVKRLEGERDYRNFCKMDVGNGVINMTRRIDSTALTVIETRPHGYSMCELTIVGKAFLWHQIRCIVAILFLIGQGKEEPEIIDELLDIEKHPRKPQYHMASEVPLVLYETEYADVNWIYEIDCQEENVEHLQELWSYHSVKTTMIKRIIEDLETVKVIDTATGEAPVAWTDCHPPVLHQSDCLLPGHKPRIYKPLLQRDKCESLEERIQYFAKRRKLDIVTTNSQEKTKSDVGEDESMSSS